MSSRATRVAWGSVVVLGAASAIGSALLPNLPALIAGWMRWGHEVPVLTASAPDRESATPAEAPSPGPLLGAEDGPLSLELVATITDPDDTRGGVVIDGILWVATGGGLLRVALDAPGSSRWWTTADGLPDHRLTAIARWTDGLVVGTEGGSLIHLGLPGPDEVDPDRRLDVRSVVSLTDCRISDLVADEGLLWVGTWGAGAWSGDPAQPAGFRALGPSHGLKARQITSVARLDGELIAGTAGAGLWVRADEGPSRLFVARGGLVSDFVLDVARVGDRVVAAGPGGVSRYRAGSLQTFEGGGRLPAGVVRAVAAGDDDATLLALSGGRLGTLGSTATSMLPPAPDGLGPWSGVPLAEARWLLPLDGGVVAGTPRGLVIATDDGLSWLSHAGPGSNDLTSVDARGGELLVGTWDLGAAHTIGGGWSPIQLGSGEINDVLLTDDAAWLATSGGLSRVDASGRARTFGIEHGLAHVHVSALAQDAGGLLVGSSGGVQRFDGVGFVSLGGPDAGSVGNVYSLAVGDGVVWAGTLEGLWELSDGSGRRARYESGELPDNWVNAVAVSPGGALWAGTYDQGIARLDRGARLTLREADGLVSGWVNPDAMAALPDGTVLVGTMGGGLMRVGPGGLLDGWTTADGLAGDDVTGVAVDGTTIWVATRSGLSRMEVTHAPPRS